MANGTKKALQSQSTYLILIYTSFFPDLIIVAILYPDMLTNTLWLIPAFLVSVGLFFLSPDIPTLLPISRCTFLNIFISADFLGVGDTNPFRNSITLLPKDIQIVVDFVCQKMDFYAKIGFSCQKIIFIPPLEYHQPDLELCLKIFSVFSSYVVSSLYSVLQFCCCFWG
jgi:hypothetical protein